MTPDQVRQATRLLAEREHIAATKVFLTNIAAKLTQDKPASAGDFLDVLQWLPERTETTEALYEVLKTAHFLWELETDTKLRALGVDTQVEST